MPQGKGFQGIFGVKKAATWGTEVVIGATDLVELESLSAPGGLDRIPDDQMTGSITRRQSSAGNHKMEIDISTAYRYEGLGPLISLVLGSSPAPAAADTSAYLHTVKPLADPSGIFGTVAYEYLKDAFVGVIPAVKFHELTISGKQGERIKINVKGIGNTFTDASASNTTTTIDSATYPTNREYATFSQVLFKMNDQTAGSLSAADIFIQGFEIKISRPVKEMVTTEFGNKSSEHAASGFADITGKFDFAAVQNGTGGNALFLAEQMANTPKKAKIEILGGTTIGATTRKTGLDIWMPYIVLRSGAKPCPSEPGVIAWSQDVDMHHVGTIPTGFSTGYTDAITIDQYNLRATGNLA